MIQQLVDDNIQQKILFSEQLE